MRQLVTRRPGLVTVVYELQLAHGCLSCSVRNDVLPTLLDVAENGYWKEVLLGLPVPVLPTAGSRVLQRAAAGGRAVRPAVRMDGVTTVVDAE